MIPGIATQATTNPHTHTYITTSDMVPATETEREIEVNVPNTAAVMTPNDRLGRYYILSRVFRTPCTILCLGVSLVS